MPEVHVVFQHGANEGVDPKLLPDGWLTRAENVRFRKDGRPGSRFGYDFVSGSVGQAIAGGSYGPSHSVYFKERTSATTPAKWFDRRADGNYTAATVATSVGTIGVPRRLPGARNLEWSCVASDVATAGGYLFEVYCDTALIASSWSAGTVYVNIADALSHRAIVSAYSLGAGGNCKAVAIGTKVLVFWADTAGAIIKFAVFDSSSPTAAPTTGTCVTAFAGKANRFDVAPLSGTNCLLVYQTSAINLAFGQVGNTGVFTLAQNQAVANEVRPSITLGATSGNAALCWAEGATFLTGNLHYLVSTVAGTPVTAKTTLDSSGNVTGFPVAGPNATADYAFAWNLADSVSALKPACVLYNGGGATTTVGYLNAFSKPFTGPNNSCLLWAVNHALSTDTAGIATYKLIDVGSVAAMSGIGNVGCEAVSCQTQAVPGSLLQYAPGTVDPRRFCVALTSVLTAPSSTAVGCFLPVYSAPGTGSVTQKASFGADLVRIDSSPWADRLLPTRINGQLIFSGPRVREFDGTALVESGMEAPEVVTLLQVAAGSIPAGTYQYVITREWVDHGGRKHRSPPSTPVSITLGSALNVSLSASGQPFSDRNMSYRIWRTTNGGTVFYLIDSTSVASVVATSGTLTVTHTDSNLDSSIILNEVLYTQGARGGLSGLLPNDEPPPCRFIWAGNNRVIMGGLEQAEAVQWSKLVFPGEPVQYSVDSGFVARIDAEVTGVACLDGTWFVGSQSGIFAFSGQGPDDNGGGGTFGDPLRLPSDIGFYSQRSIVEVPKGLLFQGRSDRIYLLPRGGGTPEWIGQPVRDTLALYPFIADAELIPDSNVAVFSCLNSAGTDGRLLIYDTRVGEWTVDVPFNGAAATNRALHCLTTYGGKLVLDGQITETALYADDESGSQNRAIVMTEVTGDMRPFGAAGHGRMRRVVLLCEYRSATTFTIEESLDGGVTWQTPASYTPSNTAGDTVKVSYDLPVVRGEAYRFRITSTPTTPGEGFVFNSLTAEVFPEKGTPRLADAYRA